MLQTSNKLIVVEGICNIESKSIRKIVKKWLSVYFMFFMFEKKIIGGKHVNE